MPDQPDQLTEPEFLGSDSTQEHPGRRWGLIGAACLAVVAAAGAGAWGVAQLMAGGSSPASAVPADAVAYLSVDLDPSASQKIEALNMLKKFPAVAEELDLGVRDDLRRWAFEQFEEESPCKGFDYDTDVGPWLGDKMGVAVVPDGDEVVPLVLVQVSDQDAARAGIRQLADCGEEEAGMAFVDDYALLGEKQAVVDKMASAASASALDEDPDFLKWMDRAGDPGIITAYASADSLAAVMDLAQHSVPGQGSTALDSGGRETYSDSVLAASAASDDKLQRLQSVFEDFEGAALVVRFADGSVEAEAVSSGLPSGMAATGAGLPALGALPETTALALSVALPENWLQDYIESMEDMLGEDLGEQDMWSELEAGTGLDLPGDIETLLGDGVTVSVDASTDLRALMETPEPADVPIGIQIAGEPAEISPVLDKVLAQAGPMAKQLVVEETEDGVSVGLQQEYVDRLVAGGSLGTSDSFRRVIAERASSAFYVDFDAGDGWADRLADELGSGDPEVGANVAPLDAVGVSSWMDEGVSHALFKMTTD
ncbi:hypothetical protein BH18ACT9_BH18ACT9_12230 [soil metagenome]